MNQLRLIRNVPVDEGRTAADGLFPDLSAREVAEWLRMGTCPSERSFDQFLSEEHRFASSQHWTPLVVALRVAEWINELPIKTVVDIGSGAGKFCVATALATQCDFIGIEQRVRLVRSARKLAKIFGVDDRIRFIQGTMSQDGLPKADAYYLYNPFAEHLFGPEDHLDEDVEFSGENYAYDVASVEAFLDQAPAGTYLIIYNGFGGRVPQTYDEVHIDREMPNVLRMWQKSRRLRFEPRPR